MEQQLLPTLGWPALVPGPVFLCFEWTGKPPHKGRHRSRLVIPREAWSYPRDPKAPRYMTEAGVKKLWIQHYADPVTEAHEKALREYATLLMNQKHVPPLDGPVALLVHAFREVPESWSKNEKARALAGNIMPTSRPDEDNYLKFVKDALNDSGVWTDDAVVVDGRCIKLYSSAPALRIEIRPMIEPKP